MSRNAGYGMFVCGVVALAAAVASAWADPPAATPDGGGGKPRIVFEELDHDFGHVVAGEALKTSFGFKNAGDGVLVIEKVKGG